MKQQRLFVIALVLAIIGGILSLAASVYLVSDFVNDWRDGSLWSVPAEDRDF